MGRGLRSNVVTSPERLDDSSNMSTWLRHSPIAHRGLHGDDAPENSLPAFAAAIAAGYAIELDVRLLADETVVVFHDAELSRLTEARGPVAARTCANIDKLRLLGTQAKIPTLREVLDLVDGQVPLLIEIKNRGRAGRLERALWRCLVGYRGAFAIQAFSPYSLAWFRVYAPHVLRGQLACDFRDEDLPKHHIATLKRLLMHPLTAADFIAYDHHCLPYWPATLARKAGLPVLAWTITSRAQMGQALKHGDNVIFEGFRP